MMNRRFGWCLSLGLALLIAFSLGRPAEACVGKTLIVGATGTIQQQVLAEILATLISERTGTTVKVVQLESHAAAHEALLKADLDMYVEYTGLGLAQVLDSDPVTDPAALYTMVKTRYNEDLNLVWLEPLGFEAPEVVPAGVPAQAAPVVRKDTLKKFPALARLINKLGGVINAEAMHGLEEKSRTDGAKNAARDFLKKGRFI